MNKNWFLSSYNGTGLWNFKAFLFMYKQDQLIDINILEVECRKRCCPVANTLIKNVLLRN